MSSIILAWNHLIQSCELVEIKGIEPVNIHRVLVIDRIMARWELVSASESADLGVLGPLSWMAALLPTVIVFYVCISMLLALCAARSSAPSDGTDQDFNLNIHPGEPDGELAMESRKLSHRFSSSSTAAITKLGASFRISSFRTQIPSSSFRISPLLLGADCTSQVDVADHAEEVEEMTRSSAEPAVWQRVILRGKRCAPLSFSGLVLYDEHGNPLPSPTTTTTTTTSELHNSPTSTQHSAYG